MLYKLKISQATLIVRINFLNELNKEKKKETDDVLTEKKFDENKTFNQLIKKDLKNHEEMMTT